MKNRVICLNVLFLFFVLAFTGCQDDPVEPQNLAPIANAGLDQTVESETLVILDGSNSSDPENDGLTYAWTSLDTTIILSNVNIVNPSFTAPDVAEDTEYTFHLVVNDGEHDSELDEVVITVLHVVPAFNILVDYMENNGMSINDLLNNWIVNAGDIVDELDTYYIMDIRTADSHGATVADAPDGIVDYDNGHVPGAVLSSLTTIVADAAYSVGLPILVVCYTGHHASYAVMALRLSGYSDAKVLKWGMSSWHSDFDKWTSNVAQLNHVNWIAAPGNINEPNVFNYPDFDTDYEDGASILAERITYILDNGLMGIISIEILDSFDDYFINNYWYSMDVEVYGNIEGAYRIKPLVLENLDSDKEIITYGWTGQTESMITAYLNILGYQAKVLKFGVNSIIYDDLLSHKWVASWDFDYEVTQ